jgi:hypothetical protein
MAKGFESRIPISARRFLEERESKNPLTEIAFVEVHSPSKPFVYGDTNAEPTVALWGDSHANAIAFEMGKIAKERHLSFQFYGRSGNPPLVGILLAYADGRALRDYNSEVLQTLEADSSVKVVVLAARWSLSLEGATQSYGPAENSAPLGSRMLRDTGKPYDSLGDAEVAYATSVRRTISELQKAGKTVCLIYPIPEVGFDVPTTLARECIERRDPSSFRVPASGIFFERQAFVRKLFDSLSSSFANAPIVRLRPSEFLLNHDYIRLQKDGEALYCDNNHLSLAGAHLLRPLFEEVFDVAIQKNSPQLVSEQPCRVFKKSLKVKPNVMK